MFSSNLCMMSNRESHQNDKGDDGSGHGIPIHHSKQRHCDPKQATTSGLKNVMQEVWTNEHELHFESFLRRVIREEMKRTLQNHLCERATANEGGTSRATPLELRFINKLPHTIFTQVNIIAEDKTPIQIALWDVKSQSVVKVGPLSSIKIEICALKGDFGSNGSEDWTEGEFNANISNAREGKRPLLNGDKFITLKNGVGYINRLMFTDNSRWLRSRKFRLGVKAVQPNSSEVNIKEGRSEPFVVKEYRGESSQKHYPPSLKDEVWRLEHIAKTGKTCGRLSRHGIHTVGDLLRLYTTNPSSLLEKVGNIQKNSWQAIIKHAKTCVIEDDKLYVYHIAQHSIDLFFNSIYVLVAATFHGQNYCSLDTLNPGEKHWVEKFKQDAYKDVDNIKPIDETSLSCLGPLACLGAGQSDTTEPGLTQFNISTAQHGHQGAWSGYDQPYASTSYEGANNYQTYVDPLPYTREMPLNSEINGGILSDLCFEGDSLPPNDTYFPVMQGGNSTENDAPHIQFTNCCPPWTAWEQGNDFCFAPSDGVYNIRADFCHSHFLNSTVNMSSNGKPKTLWHKIRSALKCVISVRNDAAAKRNGMLLN